MAIAHEILKRARRVDHDQVSGLGGEIRIEPHQGKRSRQRNAMRLRRNDDSGLTREKSVGNEPRENAGEVDPNEIAQGGNLYALVQNMTVFQKIKLGRMGNKEARSLLVRDRNKVVAVAAVTSPKITENELLSIAQSRNVCDEVIRTVSNSREATRHYMVKLALAQNPRTPQAIAMQFANYLQDKDLRGLMKSKDVPSAISTHARRILMKKGKL